jgi:nitrilase
VQKQEHAVPTKVAVVQKPPVLLDRTATIERLMAAIDEAADGGASLVVLPEAFIPGYPTWIWRLRPGGDIALAGELHARLRANAINIAAGDLAPVCEATRERRVTLVCGINELDSDFSGTTLFNTVVVIGPDGAMLHSHRKLVPTNPERMVWGRGDGRSLKVVDTPAGRIGVLVCWENYMPLARYALYAQNIDILIAPTWDCGEEWLASMRHIAREGGTWVVATGTAIQGLDVPADFPERGRLFTDDEWLCDGGAVIVRPSGKILAGPMLRDKGILYGEIDRDAALRARRSLDVTGHYARPDVFQLHIDRKPKLPVMFDDSQARP